MFRQPIMQNLSRNRILGAYNRGYTLSNIIQILDPSIGCSNIPITDCPALSLYAGCLDVQAIARFQLLNILFPEIQDTKILLDKYSTGLYSLLAKTCIPNDTNSLVYVTNNINDLAGIEYQEYTILLDILSDSLNRERARSFQYLVIAGLVAFYFANIANSYYKKYRSCKEERG